MFLLKSIHNFRDRWLEDFFLYGKSHRKIPASLEAVLARKLDIINAAASHYDLRSPPGNMYEVLNPPFGGYSAIRVNKQYRLIFQWVEGRASNIWLDAHTYKPH
jgi:proteic killer suppression protein